MSRGISPVRGNVDHATPTSPESASTVDGPVRVLLVEDSELDADLVRHALKNPHGAARFALERVACVKDALASLEANEFGALILDLGLPDASRLSGLERVLAANPALPVVVITGSGEQVLGPEALRAGAQDYILKDQASGPTLEKSLSFAIERVRAQRKEKQLLEETLHGTIKALTTVLSLVNPAAFGRAQRLKEYVSETARLLSMPQRWTVEVAAMVSQIGWVQHSTEDCEMHYSSRPSPNEGQRLVQDMPSIAAELLAGIPHLESVRGILALQARESKRRADPSAHPYSPEVVCGAELLSLAIQFDILETQLGSRKAALEGIQQRADDFDVWVFEAFAEVQRRALSASTECALTARDLLEGMIIAADVVTPDGLVVVARGHEVTASLLARMRFFSERGRIAEPIRVHVPRADKSAGSAAG